MFRCCSYTIIRERINLCLLKLHLLKQSIKIHWCVVNFNVNFNIVFFKDKSLAHQLVNK